MLAIDVDGARGAPSFKNPALMMNQTQRQRISREAGIWILGSLCRFHRIAFEPKLFLQRHPPSPEDGHFSPADICLAAQELGFGTDARTLQHADELSAMTLPCLVFLTNDTAEPSSPTPATPALIAAVDRDQVTYFEPGSEAPVPCGKAQIVQNTTGACWVFTPQFEPLKDEDGAKAQAAKSFGFAWFIPEILKHGKVWRDILAASLALQLIGLVTPLFTQVVIDKVVVHQAQSTLIAVGVGLAISIVFSAVFSWVRQYLVLHTGNRIDAVLGSRVFSHLLKLPMPYFAHRPTGTLVARLHGVETVREFLSGAAVTLLLDLPFMSVLVVVMFWYSWQLSLIAIGLLVLLGVLSFAVTPIFKSRLDRQFLLGARNQAFTTEYVSGMETVKSLQMEPQLEKRYGAYLAEYLAAGFDTKQLANTYNTAANALGVWAAEGFPRCRCLKLEVQCRE